MYIITVIPIIKSPQKENLSYFSSIKIDLGMIVSVPLRNKDVNALVIGVKNVLDSKSEVKSASFQLKKINKLIGPAPFNDSFFQACQRISRYSFVETGSVINAFLPKIFIENISLLKNSNIKEIEKKDTISEIEHEKLIFQSLNEDRLSWYRTLIRESFAKKESLYICVPTRYDIEELKELLKKGIEQYVFSFHSDLAKKILINSYNECITNSHPVLIIGTGMFLSIQRSDIKTIIIEKESSEAYKQFSRPFLDTRTFAEVFSSIKKIKLIFGDTLLRPETLYRYEISELGEVTSPTFRLPQVEKQEIVDMKNENDNQGKKSFQILSQKAKDVISESLKENGVVFLFSLRKGLAGATVCNDCGYTLLCPNCSTPIVLYGKKQRSATKDEGGRIFMCNKCGRKERTEIRCTKCDSWNLNPLGIGADRVYEEVIKNFPKTNVIQIDKENTPSDKEVISTIDLFYKNGGGILIGTELAFSYLKNKVKNSIITSFDGLLSIPSYNINQKILRIIEKLNYLTEKNLVIQTRVSDNRTLKYILSGNILPMYREDLKERKLFGYPPFKKLVKITFTGGTKDNEKVRVYLNDVLSRYEPQIFSAFIGKIKGEYITNTVIKLDPKLWPLPINKNFEYDKELSEILSSLPPNFAINLEPEDLL